MKLRLDATADELRTKGAMLIKALSAHLQVYNPELAENLEKALRKEPALKYRLLRDLHNQSADAYDRHARQMRADIELVLRGQPPKALAKAQTKTTETTDDPDYDPESGEPIFDPKTGMSPSEKAKDKEDHPDDYKDDDEDTEKSVGHMHEHPTVDDDGDELAESDDDDDAGDDEAVAAPPPPSKREPVKKAFKDHTQAIAQKDDRLYQNAKRAAMDWDATLTDQDFDKKGGRFYGWSTNQIVDWVREKRK